MRSVAFVGLGTMGSRMVRNLRSADLDLTLVDVNLAIAQQLAAEVGGVASASAAGAAGCDAVILMLPNSGIVESVLGKPDDAESLASQLKPGSLVIDMGSSDPASSASLAEMLREREIRFVDAPVSGGPSKAATAELTIMIGGLAEDVEAATTLLRHFGSTIIPTGGVGSGHAMKALNNMLSAIGLVGALEVLAAGMKFGLDPHVMLSVINASTGRNQSTEAKIEQQVLSGHYNVGFSLGLTIKDISTALRLADSGGIDMQVGAATVDFCVNALERLGRRGADQSEIARVIAEQAGVRFDTPHASRVTMD